MTLLHNAKSFVGQKDIIAIRMVFLNKRDDSLVDTFLQVHQTIDYQTRRYNKNARHTFARKTCPDWKTCRVISVEILFFWRYFTFTGVSFSFNRVKKIITDDITLLWSEIRFVVNYEAKIPVNFAHSGDTRFNLPYLSLSLLWDIRLWSIFDRSLLLDCFDVSSHRTSLILAKWINWLNRLNFIFWVVILIKNKKV